MRTTTMISGTMKMPRTTIGKKQSNEINVFKTAFFTMVTHYHGNTGNKRNIFTIMP